MIPDQLKALFEKLQEERIRYVIPWGYEKLPKEITGTDLDMIVHQEDVDKIQEVLTGLGYQLGRHSYGKYQKCPQTHLLAHSTALDIDIWDHFCANDLGERKIHLYGDEVTDRSRTFHLGGVDIAVPDEVTELYILWNRSMHDKYRIEWKARRIDELVLGIYTNERMRQHREQK